MPLIPLIWAGSAALAALGYAADKTGEGVNDASNGAVKLAAAAAVGAGVYLLAKKQGWI
jgi:hypothetical protein